MEESDFVDSFISVETDDAYFCPFCDVGSVGTNIQQQR